MSSRTGDDEPIRRVDTFFSSEQAKTCKFLWLRECGERGTLSWERHPQPRREERAYLAYYYRDANAMKLSKERKHRRSRVVRERDVMWGGAADARGGVYTSLSLPRTGCSSRHVLVKPRLQFAESNRAASERRGWRFSNHSIGTVMQNDLMWWFGTSGGSAPEPGTTPSRATTGSVWDVWEGSFHPSIHPSIPSPALCTLCAREWPNTPDFYSDGRDVVRPIVERRAAKMRNLAQFEST